MLTNDQFMFITQKVVRILLIIIGGEIAKNFIVILIKKLNLAQKIVPGYFKGAPKSSQQNRFKTLSNLLKNSAKLIINFIVIIMVLSEVGIDIAPLIAGAGIVGLAIGFGAKELVADIISGFFIILENQFYIGDKVIIAANEGKVVKITLRTITLKDKAGKIYIIPNSTIKTVTRFPRKK